MSALNNIGDEEFVPFLQNLGVETYNKSFEWMLNDPEFSDVLHWMYNNLDHNNALTAREECRYKELEEKGLLSPEDLESSIASIQKEYAGISLPGDKDAKEDVELDIRMLEERLHMLERHEKVLADLKEQNKLANEELSLEISKLNSAHRQCKDDESAAAEECLTLAQEVETITNEVMDVIADKLEVYSSCHSDKENAKKFFTFGPFETYRQSQALFRSHFDLYTSKKFGKRQNDTSTEDELRAALVEAKSMEERLSHAMCKYIETKSVLCGEQAKLTLVANYKDVHPSQITSCLMEAQSAVELLEEEESILYQQLNNAVKQFVDARTTLAVETTASCALAVRQQIQADLSHLLDTTQRALSLDRVVYGALRHELRSVEQFLQLAADMKQYAAADADAVISRINSMNEICSEQKSCELKIQSSDVLIQTLLHIFGAQPGTDPGLLVNMYQELQGRVKELKTGIEDGYKRKEDMIAEFKVSTQALRANVWDGSTRQPRGGNNKVAALVHQLRQQLDGADKKVVDASTLFTSVKNGDKQCLRKLWQWFLTDPARFLSALKNANCKMVS